MDGEENKVDFKLYSKDIWHKIGLFLKNRWVDCSTCHKCKFGLIGRCLADGCSFRYRRDHANNGECGNV
jgi:hypothetical protein